MTKRDAVRINPAALQGLMMHAGLSDTALAKAANIHRTYITNMVAGRRITPSAEVAKRIAIALRVPTTAIMADPEEVDD